MTERALMPGRHIPALDGLRGVAVLGVVAHHLGHLTGGYLGVDAFFVLSGFLITGLLLDELARDGDAPTKIDLARFWMRRAKRLLPAFFVVLATVVVVERWFLDDGVSDVTLRDESLSSLLYIFNWQAIVNDVDYWATFAAVSPLRHMWSLAIEEQFYVVWPLVVAAAVSLAARRRISTLRTQTVVAGVAAVGFIASAALQLGLYSTDDALRVYYGTDTRVAAILLGCVGAYLVRRMPALGEALQRSAGAVALLLVVPIAWAWMALDGTSPTLYRGGMLGVGIATAIVVSIAAVAPRSLLSSLLSLAPLRWFGRISYGLYLWHWPMIVWLTPERIDVHGWQLLVLRLAASMALTMLSYHLIEQPIRRAQWSGRRTAGWTLFALANLVPLSVGFTANAESVPPPPDAGTRSTLPIPTRPATTPALATTVPARIDEGLVSAGEAPDVDDAPVPITAAAPEPSRIMVVGDSGAFFLGELLVEGSADRALVLPRGEIGCGIVNIAGGALTEDGVLLPDPEDCDDWPQRWTDDAAQFEPDISLIVLSWPGIGNRNLTDIGGNGTAHPCDEDFDQHYTERVRLAIDSARSGGGRVVVATNPYYSGPGADGTFVQRVDCLNRVMTTTATSNNADILDLAAWTCPNGQCRLDVDGATLRPDGLHFDGEGGSIAAAWVLDQLVGP